MELPADILNAEKFWLLTDLYTGNVLTFFRQFDLNTVSLGRFLNMWSFMVVTSGSSFFSLEIYMTNYSTGH